MDLIHLLQQQMAKFQGSTVLVPEHMHAERRVGLSAACAGKLQLGGSHPGAGAWLWTRPPRDLLCVPRRCIRAFPGCGPPLLAETSLWPKPKPSGCLFRTAPRVRCAMHVGRCLLRRRLIPQCVISHHRVSERPAPSAEHAEYPLSTLQYSHVRTQSTPIRTFRRVPSAEAAGAVGCTTTRWLYLCFGVHVVLSSSRLRWSRWSGRTTTRTSCCGSPCPTCSSASGDLFRASARRPAAIPPAAPARLR